MDSLFPFQEKSESEAASTNGMAASKTLSDSARELEEARAAKRKYDEVTVVTGEEDEQNALQVYGKLFTFDKVQGEWRLPFIVFKGSKWPRSTVWE